MKYSIFQFTCDEKSFSLLSCVALVSRFPLVVQSAITDHFVDYYHLRIVGPNLAEFPLVNDVNKRINNRRNHAQYCKLLQMTLQILFLIACTTLSVFASESNARGEVLHLARNIFALHGVLYDVPHGHKDTLVKSAVEMGFVSGSNSNSDESNRKIVLSLLKKLPKEDASTPRLKQMLKALKGKVKVEGWTVDLGKFYDSFRRNDDPMRDFINSITSAIVRQYDEIQGYFTKAADNVAFARLNNVFREYDGEWKSSTIRNNCLFLTKNKFYSQQINDIVKVASAAFKLTANKQLLLEAVVVAVIENLRVHPCVLDSTDKVTAFVEKAHAAFGIPQTPTVFDPFRHILYDVSTNPFQNEYLMAVSQFLEQKKSGPLSEREINARLRVWNYFEGKMVEGSAGEIREFIKSHTEFAPGSLLREYHDSVSDKQ